MRDVPVISLKNCIVNFYCTMDVPEDILKEPSFFRLHTKPREPRNSGGPLSDALDDALNDLIAKWAEDEAAEEEAIKDAEDHARLEADAT